MNPMLIFVLNDIKDEYVMEANPSDWREFREEYKNVKTPKSRGKGLFIAILILLAVMTFAFAASYTSFFAKWFLSPETQGQTEPFITGNDAGIVVDDDAIKIEALDSVQSGHIIKTAFLITIKNLDSVVVPEALGPMKGYRFENTRVLDNLVNVRDYQYLYSCDYAELQNNQMHLIINSESQNDIFGAVLVKLHNLGYYDKTSTFVRHYDGNWEWSFSAQNNSAGEHFTIDQDVLLGEKMYHVADMKISALGLEIVCEYPDWEKVSNINPKFDLFSDFAKAAADFSITLSDGSLLPLNFSMVQGTTGYDWDGTLRINAVFDQPLVISDVKSIKILSFDYQLQ
jgi:hypothetical protein